MALPGVFMLLGVPTASAAVPDGPTQKGQICMQNVFGAPMTNANKLNCTANDIKLSTASNPSPATCTEGETFTLTADFTTVVTANSRYDAGFFFRTDGKGTARGDVPSAAGVCSLSALEVPIPAGSESPALDLDGDVCGDLNAGTYTLTFTIPDVVCTPVSDTDRRLRLPNCTSWHSNQDTACDILPSPDPNSPVPLADLDFDPDTKSKCVCDDEFTVPVIVESASATVSVTSDVFLTRDIVVTNTSTTRQVRLNAICDNVYGTLGGGGCGPVEFPLPLGTAINTCNFAAGQGPVLYPTSDLDPNHPKSFTCSYDVDFDPSFPLTTVANKVTALLVDAANNSAVSPSPTDTATVTLSTSQ